MIGEVEQQAVTAPPQDPFCPGSQIDHFQVVRQLGRGGMGEVYLARDTTLGRRVALKVIQPARLGAKAAVERFLREARTTASFSHPNIVTIYYAGSHGGRPYVALEYLEGQTLRQRMREDRPGLREGLRWGLSMALALAEAHRHRVLHRDLKPENVMLCRDGRLRVVDFGLAKLVESPDEPAEQIDGEALTAERETLSTLGKQVRGTPEYMAPEQWRNGPVNESADVWALGVVLYELVCGHRPYPGASFFGLALKVASGDPVPPLRAPDDEDLGQPVVQLVHSCLEKDPARRPGAAEVAERLRGLIAGWGRQQGEAEEAPFRGLRPFTERHASMFFGREREVAAAVEQLREEPVLPIIGPSGAGKSSFVRAGVIPRLQEQGPWTVIRMRPGERPFRVLATQLLSTEKASRDTTISLALPADGAGAAPTGEGDRAEQDGSLLARRLREAPHLLSLTLEQIAASRRGRVLLFVDQLEELFTLVSDEQERQRFIEALCAAADDPENPMRVIFTLREDFLGRLAGGPRVQETLGRVVLLGPPDAGALKRILSEPVRARGYHYDEDGLVGEIVAAAGAEPGSLPLLQFTAQMLWERRDRQGRRLTREAYQGIGGVEGALAAHAEGVLEGLPAAARATVRQIFMRLVTPSRTRRVLPLHRLVEGLGSDAEGLVGRLVQARLIAARRSRHGDEETVLELVHESLIRHWTRLARWIDRGREDLAFLAEVEQAATLWERRGRREDDLWQGDALHDALAAVGRCATPLPAIARRFLAAGERRKRRRVRRRRLVLAAVVAVAVALALVFAYQKRQADRGREAARRRWAEAQCEGARAALVRGDLLEARAKLRGSLETEDSAMARALWWRLRDEPLSWSRSLGGSVYSVDFSADGKKVAGACQDRSVYLLDVATGQVHALRGYRDQVLSVAFAPGGGMLAAGTWSGQVTVRRGRGPVRVVGEHTAAVRWLRFSPDGRRLAAAATAGNVVIWDVREGRRVAELAGSAGTLSLAFSPDGGRLALGGGDGLVRLINADGAAATQGRRLKGHQGGVTSVQFSRDGRLLLSAGADGTVRLWDAGSGARIRVLRGHTSMVMAAAISPDGQTVASAGKDQNLRLWNLQRGGARLLTGHSGAVHGLAFSRDGRRVVTGGEDGTVRLWRLSVDPRRQVARGHGERVYGVAFSPDGRLLASGSKDGAIRLWDVASGSQVRILRGHTDRVSGLAFSADGKYLASGGYDRTIRLWYRPRGYAPRVLGGHWGRVLDLAFSPDGSRLASAGNDSRVRLWDVNAGTQVAALTGHTQGVTCVSFSADGELLASGGRDHVVRIWRASDGSPRGELKGHPDQVTGVSFAPDGGLVVGCVDGTVWRWDLTRHERRQLWEGRGRGYLLDTDATGRWVGVPRADGRALLIDVSGGAPVWLEGHRGEVNTLRFSPDGRLVSTASDDGTVRLWEVPSGRPAWRAPVLLSGPPRLLTHRGWVNLASGKERPIGRPGLERALERRVASSDELPGGDALCVLTRSGSVERWQRRDARRLFSADARGANRVIALTDGCVTLDGERAKIFRDGRLRCERPATAAARDRDGLLVAGGGRATVLDASCRAREGVAVSAAVTALTRVEGQLALGFRDGSIELPTRLSQPEGLPRALEDTPPSPVVRLLPGPPGTLLAGFANGVLGLWNLRTGDRLSAQRLHGPLAHLRRTGSTLYAASELGDYLVLDLSTFQQAYCRLVREVWRAVPTVWEVGEPVVRAPPPGHRCAAR